MPCDPPGELVLPQGRVDRQAEVLDEVGQDRLALLAARAEVLRAPARDGGDAADRLELVSRGGEPVRQRRAAPAQLAGRPAPELGLYGGQDGVQAAQGDGLTGGGVGGVPRLVEGLEDLPGEDVLGGGRVDWEREPVRRPGEDGLLLLAAGAEGLGGRLRRGVEPGHGLELGPGGDERRRRHDRMVRGSPSLVPHGWVPGRRGAAARTLVAGAIEPHGGHGWGRARLLAVPDRLHSVPALLHHSGDCPGNQRGHRRPALLPALWTDTPTSPAASAPRAAPLTRNCQAST